LEWIGVAQLNSLIRNVGSCKR